jgi:trigger factor
VKVDTIKKMNLPEVNDEFAQSVGEFADIAALRTSVRQGLEANAKEEYEREYFDLLTEKLVETATIKYPPQLLDEEVDSMLESVQKDLARQNMDLNTYLKVRNMDRETFIETEVRPSAGRRLARTLLLDEVARAESIQPDNAEIEATFSQTMAELEHTGEMEKLRKQMPVNRLANAVAMEAINRAMSRGVLTRLKSIATGEADQVAAAPEGASTPETEPAKADEPVSDATNPAVEEPASDEVKPTAEE